MHNHSRDSELREGGCGFNIMRTFSNWIYTILKFTSKLVIIYVAQAYIQSCKKFYSLSVMDIKDRVRIRSNKFSINFLNIVRDVVLPMYRPGLFHSIITEKNKEFVKKLFLTMKRRTLSLLQRWTAYLFKVFCGI